MVPLLFHTTRKSCYVFDLMLLIRFILLRNIHMVMVGLFPINHYRLPNFPIVISIGVSYLESIGSNIRYVPPNPSTIVRVLATIIF
jgi:hypothetical protein